MKKWTILFLAITFASNIFWSCSDSSSSEPENKIPLCSITFPSEGDTYHLGEIINFIGVASDVDGKITNVKIYVNSSILDSLETESFSIIINSSEYEAGDLIIKVVVQDNDGAEASDQVTISLTNSTPSISSVITDSLCIYPYNSTLVTCKAIDDDGDLLSYNWQKTGGTISGTGSNIIWTAPSTPGTYTITCTIDDGFGGISTMQENIYVINEITPAVMVLVNSGYFNMGCSYTYAEDFELPTHNVTLSNFYLGKYEVSQSEWGLYMPHLYNFNYGMGSNYPVYYVSWYEIIKYCNLRSIAEGLTPCYSISSSTDPEDWGTVPTSSNSIWNAASCNWTVNGYRLPTEAEWEYAAGGAKYNNTNTYSGGTIFTLNDVAWWRDNSNGTSHIVGRKLRNEINIYDMTGNIEEFCWDWFGEDYYQTCYDLGNVTNPRGPSNGSNKIKRGGYFNSSKSTYDDQLNFRRRTYSSPWQFSNSCGFRLARTK